MAARLFRRFSPGRQSSVAASSGPSTPHGSVLSSGENPMVEIHEPSSEQRQDQVNPTIVQMGSTGPESGKSHFSHPFNATPKKEEVVQYRMGGSQRPESIITKDHMIEHWLTTHNLLFLPNYGFTGKLIEQAYEQFQHKPQILSENVVHHRRNKEFFLQIEQNIKDLQHKKIARENDYKKFVEHFNHEISDLMRKRNVVLREGLLIEHHVSCIPKFFEHIQHELKSHHEIVNHGSANVMSGKPQLSSEKLAKEEPEWWHQFNPLHHFENIHKAFQPKTTNANWNTVNAQGLYIASH
jgi:hypothetical protein